MSLRDAYMIEGRRVRGVPRILYASRLSATATGTGDQNVFSFTIPGSLLGTTRIIRFTAFMEQTTGSGTWFIKIKYGGNRAEAFTAQTTTSWRVCGELYGDGTTSAQRGVFPRYTNVFNMTTAFASLATDSTIDQSLTIDTNLTTGTDVITIRNAIVELLYL